MPEKKRHIPKDEKINAVEADQAETNENNETDPIEIEAEELGSLRQKLSDAESKSAENLDGWQRAVAEFQNYKKRMERDRDSEKAFMKSDLIKKVLPVLDDLERAMLNRPDQDAWASGIDLITRKLQSILETEGLQRIDAKGKVFDPNYHEAISYEPNDDVESGHIIAVVQNGYLLGEHTVRS